MVLSALHDAWQLRPVALLRLEFFPHCKIPSAYPGACCSLSTYRKTCNPISALREFRILSDYCTFFPHRNYWYHHDSVLKKGKDLLFHAKLCNQGDLS